jgi:hypothetical protein
MAGGRRLLIDTGDRLAALSPKRASATGEDSEEREKAGGSTSGAAVNCVDRSEVLLGEFSV